MGRLILLITLWCVLLAAPAIGASGDQAEAPLDIDPLRRFLPRADIFVPVPGGVAALKEDQHPGDTIEESLRRRHGGLVVGYCLRASCSRVTHLAVIQVCNNRIGGAEGNRELVLGVIKLPFGNAPGWLVSLRGRNYVENFAVFGPFRQDLVDLAMTSGNGVYSVIAEGKGAVAPLQYLGLMMAPEQSHDTIAVQYTLESFPQSDIKLPRLDVRHYCDRPMS